MPLSLSYKVLLRPHQEMNEISARFENDRVKLSKDRDLGRLESC